MLMRGGQEPFGEPPRWERDTGAYVLVIVGLVMIAAILAIIGVGLARFRGRSVDLFG